MLRIITNTVIAILLAGCAANYTKVSLTTPSHYTTEGQVYTVEKNKKDIGIVFIHGKSGDPGRYHNSEFISDMRDLGYQVIAPLMPWSALRGYEGTRTDGQEVINAAVNMLHTDKVVVIGHSMGAMAVMQYGAGKVASKVVGLVAVAAGHDPVNGELLRGISEASADKACQMVKEGKGKQRGEYPEVNTGRRYTIDASAEYYCTLYSVSQYPDSLRVPRSIKTPILMVSGNDDRTTFIYDHQGMYDALPAGKKNKYEVLPGGHLDVLYRNVDKITQWIASL